MTALKALLCVKPILDDQASTMELLRYTPLEQLEDTVAALKMCRPAAEVRRAMVERIAHAPIADFDTLKHIYLKHCGDMSK